MQADVMLPWLSDRRWFAGKGRPVQGASLAASDWLSTDPRVRVEFVTVHFESAGEGERASETYQVPVSYRPERLGSLDHALIGRVPVAGEDLWAYDAVFDPEAVALWPAGMSAGRTVGEMSFRSDDAPALSSPGDSSVMSAEQSNTSVVFGDTAILKIFRRLSPGMNPDVELHRALGEADNHHIARLLGWVEGSWAEGTGTLAVANEFLPSATSGWDMALTSVRDLFAQPVACRADEAGGDFAAEAHRLGQATAAVHHDLAKVLGCDEFDPPARAAMLRAMGERLVAAVGVAPQLADLAPAISDLHRQLANWPGPLRRHRIHGDLHLGQVLRALDGWRILDFEGEPAREMEQRREPDCPLRDVAGMLRSFDYAAGHLLGPDPDATTIARAQEWARRNQQAFLDGYAEHFPGALPEEGLPLRVFSLDKACYEVLYEARNRPDWIHLPLRAVEALVKATTSGEDG